MSIGQLVDKTLYQNYSKYKYCLIKRVFVYDDIDIKPNREVARREETLNRLKISKCE